MRRIVTRSQFTRVGGSETPFSTPRKPQSIKALKWTRGENVISRRDNGEMVIIVSLKSFLLQVYPPFYAKVQEHEATSLHFRLAVHGRTELSFSFVFLYFFFYFVPVSSCSVFSAHLDRQYHQPETLGPIKRQVLWFLWGRWGTRLPGEMPIIPSSFWLVSELLLLPSHCD